MLFDEDMMINENGDYSQATEYPKPEKVERGNGENDRPHKGGTYQEGSYDSNRSDLSNTPGHEALPDEKKSNEPEADIDVEGHIEM
jgi:hypothetical protein